jgi:hypothetical protein
MFLFADFREMRVGNLFNVSVCVFMVPCVPIFEILYMRAMLMMLHASLSHGYIRFVKTSHLSRMVAKIIIIYNKYNNSM